MLHDSCVWQSGANQTMQPYDENDHAACVVVRVCAECVVKCEKEAVWCAVRVIYACKRRVGLRADAMRGKYAPPQRGNDACVCVPAKRAVVWRGGEPRARFRAARECGAAMFCRVRAWMVFFFFLR